MKHITNTVKALSPPFSPLPSREIVILKLLYMIPMYYTSVLLLCVGVCICVRGWWVFRSRRGCIYVRLYLTSICGYTIALCSDFKIYKTLSLYIYIFSNFFIQSCFGDVSMLIHRYLIDFVITEG